ncbi:MAG: hypothetical protein U5M50_12350 [Sphingobium sp.]|nr:hypothetical protein [Sphingobium sp.]
MGGQPWLTAGRQLVVDDRSGTGDLAAVEPGNVGSWRAGRLVYDNVPLSLVAADLSRYGRQQVKVGEAVAGRRFSGVLVVGDGGKLVQDVAQIMGLRASRSDGAVLLDAGGRWTSSRRVLQGLGARARHRSSRRDASAVTDIAVATDRHLHRF